MYMQDSAENFAGGLSGFFDTLQQAAIKVAGVLAPKPATPQVVYYLPGTGPTGGGGVYSEDYYPVPLSPTAKAATSTILGMSPLVLAGAGIIAIMLLRKRR